MPDNQEPFRISEPRWKTNDKGRRSLEVSIEWGAPPPLWGKRLKRKAIIALGKSMFENRMEEMQAELNAMRADLKAFFEMLEEEDDR